MTQQAPKIIQVFCGEMCSSTECTAEKINLLHIPQDDLLPNINIGYERFLENPDELPIRILDLLQIAAYVFCADRMADRGERDSISYESWARSFQFHIPVLDYEFWNNKKTKERLNAALSFMTGDRNYSFIFSRTSRNPAEPESKQLSLFSGVYSGIDATSSTDIMLFSGGLDSLAGAVQRLNENPDRTLCVVSHKSNKNVTHTQDVLISKLKEKYSGRIKKYGFECCNRNGLKSRDETQRTRIFMFSAIAFSICSYLGKHEFFVYENGITSMNLSKQVDVINARASRTTHPKTLALLRHFYQLFDPSFNIIAPYYCMTKAEILEVFKRYGEESLIASSVSCSSTRRKAGQVPHCGCCSQCIDRRFSVFAAGLSDYDALYAQDFITAFPNDDHDETKQRIYSTLRLANLEDISTPEDFLSKYPNELMDLIEFWPGLNNQEDKLNEIFDLVCRYGKSVMNAATLMRNKFDDISHQLNQNSMLGIIASRGYLRTPCSIRVEELDELFKRAFPVMFQREKPTNENDFNDKVEAILKSQGTFTRECPSLIFGVSSYRADHAQGNLIIESKFIRKGTPPSKVTEGIAADITKIPMEYGIMFVVYDPNGEITDAETFINSFQSKRNDCFVRIYK